ncbi:Transposon Ty3-I Gag-Pol polyprotein [Araneus ventricosus]|uniref:Transposon Ty3-I Gag-Pol polyprotein n=1 Tax=Araneus ventricosus TaxID=182803 RepID=A0A4Y2KFW0_ARAVE|nr:Transposon Ty3-I Gag-Pol polyprotein [Araneus ventricosus]
MRIRINQVNGIDCSDSRDAHYIAGEGLHKILQKQGMKSSKESISMTFAHGRSLNTRFSPSRGEPTPYVKHHIDTQNHPPVVVPPYRVSPSRKEILNAEVNRLLNERIILPCESSYAASAVLFTMSNGSFRLCVDYRKFNSVTKTDTYPLPRIDDLLQTAKHTQYVTTIDLKAEYHQVNVAVTDRDKTAFTCPFGFIDLFIRMPFGLKMHQQFSKD